MGTGFRRLKKVLSVGMMLVRQHQQRPVRSSVGQRATVRFSGSDDDRRELLKGLIGSGARVVSFEAKTQTLEDTFMRITRGEMQ